LPTKVVAGALEEAQIVAAGRTLASAFHDDPLQMYVFPDPEERAQRSPAQFSTLVRQGCLFGEVFTTAGMTGFSAWMPPGQVTTFEQASQAGFHELPRLMGKVAFERLGRVLDYLSDAHRQGLPAEHWYLMIVGVLPDQRGRGHGQALLEPIMARADAAGRSICLDTAQPNVKTFYEKLGFRPAIETVDPTSGLRLWTYRRDPT
jgi:GNAT superfamily N-acetyltransferase